MSLTDRGRIVFASGLTETGRFTFNNITDNGGPVFSITGIPSNPNNPPNITIVSVDHYTISNQLGMNACDVTFYFDTDVTSWTINVLGVSTDTGTVVASGGTVSANTNITATIFANEITQGSNQINLYGQNSVGWTPYEDNN